MRMKREIEIMNYLRRYGVGQINELSSLLGVSRNTVRRDLKSLDDQGSIQLMRGGAVLPDDSQFGPPLREREIKLIDEKRCIGIRAAELIPDGAAIILDAGTTTEQIAEAIRDRSGLTVITNAMNILFSLSEASDIVSVSSGGVLNTITRCFTGFHAEQFLSQFHVDLAFISGGGLTADGMTNTNTLEVQMKKTMISIADKVYAVATHDKIGRRSLAPFATLNQFAGIITDRKANKNELAELEKRGAEIIIC